MGQRNPTEPDNGRMGVGARHRLWLWWAMVGTLASLAYAVSAPGHPVRPALYGAIGLLSVLALLLGIRINRPTNAATWYLIAASKVLWLLGVLTFSGYILTGPSR